MRFAEVYHRCVDQYCYARDKDTLVIQLLAGKDVEEVFLIWGDPFAYGIQGGKEGWNGTRTPLTEQVDTGSQFMWKAVVRPEFKRCKYYFELHTGSEVWFYFENGFLSTEELSLEGRMLQCFTFPWLHEADVNQVPDWARNIIWYQIFPDRFNPGTVCTEKQKEKWRAGSDGPVTNREFYGGTLRGVTERLEYLKYLGVSGIYFTPVFEAPSVHKYDTTDYLRVDPCFGEEKDLVELSEKAHELGFRILLDGVFNHCGPRFRPWLDVLEKGPESKYYEWFFINQWPLPKEDGSTRNGAFYSFAFTSNMPKLNTANPEVIEYLCGVCEEWVQRYQIDGLRLDVANELSHQFCRELRRRMKALRPDFYLVGEIWHDAVPWLRGDEFDSVMNYPLTSAVQDFWLDEKMSFLKFAQAVNRCYCRYMEQTNSVLFNLLDSHDTLRLRTLAGGEDAFLQQLAILLTMPGSPCLYYGTEVAMQGGHDPDCRRCMPWDRIESGEKKEILTEVKRLISLRASQPLCREGALLFLTDKYPDNRIICYHRRGMDHHFIEVVLNCSQEGILLPAQGGEILYSRKWEKEELLPGGIVISHGVPCVE